MTVTSLYRFHDAHGRLLYIGITSRLGRRFYEHAKTKPWQRDAATITVQHFPTRQAAERAERIAIETEHPAHNITHNHQPGPGAISAIQARPLQAIGTLHDVARTLRTSRYDPHYSREQAAAQADLYAELGATRIHLTECRTHHGGWGVLYLPGPDDPFPMHQLDVACDDLTATPFLRETVTA